MMNTMVKTYYNLMVKWRINRHFSLAAAPEQRVRHTNRDALQWTAKLTWVLFCCNVSVGTEMCVKRLRICVVNNMWWMPTFIWITNKATVTCVMQLWKGEDGWHKEHLLDWTKQHCTKGCTCDTTVVVGLWRCRTHLCTRVGVCGGARNPLLVQHDHVVRRVPGQRPSHGGCTPTHLHQSHTAQHPPPHVQRVMMHTSRAHWLCLKGGA